MPDPKQQKTEYGELSREMAQFYHALGTFNTNIVAQLIRNPDRVKELTDLIVHHPGHPQECGVGSIWDETVDLCVRLVNSGEND